jgi:hypothetical protein
MPGKKKFPDLTGDGKVTRADILKGRGVEGFEKGGKVKVERINKKGRTDAVEKMLRRLGEMKQGSIQEKYPSKGTRPPEGKPSKLTQKDKKELSKLRPPHRDPGADDRMKKFEESAREAGFMEGGMVQSKFNRGGKVESTTGGSMMRGCKGIQTSGKGFKGSF